MISHVRWTWSMVLSIMLVRSSFLFKISVILANLVLSFLRPSTLSCGKNWSWNCLIIFFAFPCSFPFAASRYSFSRRSKGKEESSCLSLYFFFAVLMLSRCIMLHSRHTCKSIDLLPGRCMYESSRWWWDMMMWWWWSITHKVVRSSISVVEVNHPIIIIMHQHIPDHHHHTTISQR